MTPRESLDTGSPARQALIYLGLISIGIAQPLYNNTILFRQSIRADFWDFLWLALFAQVGLTALCLAIRFVLPKRPLRIAFDALVFCGVALTVARQIQLHFLQTEGLTANAKLMLVAAIVAGSLVLLFVLRRFIAIAAYYVGLFSPIFAAMFLFEMVNHPLPLNGGGENRTPTTDKAAVMLVALDEFSLPLILDDEGRIDAANFPNFAKLSRSSVWYKNAITNYPTSAYSFPSFLIGKYAYDYRKSMTDDLESLPAGNFLDYYERQGYSVTVYEDHFGCGGERFHCKSYIQGGQISFIPRVIFMFFQEFGPDFLVDRYLPQLNGWRLEHQHEVLLETARNAARGNLYFLHLMSSHAPYVFDENGGYTYSPHTRIAPGSNFQGARDNLYLQLQYLDTVMGKFLSALQQRAREVPMIVAVTSDHGNCWTPECPGRVYPKRISKILPELTDIPMFLIAPDTPPRIDADDFQLVDLYPTLLEASDLQAPETELDGVSRLNRPPPSRRRAFRLHYGGKIYDMSLPSAPKDVD